MKKLLIPTEKQMDKETKRQRNKNKQLLIIFKISKITYNEGNSCENHIEMPISFTDTNI